MDDHQKIHHIVDEDGVRFSEDRIIDFSIHNKLRDVTRLRDQDWSHVHISERALTFDGVTYSLQTDLSQEVELPEKYFGEAEEDKEDTKNTTVVVDSDKDEDDDDDEASDVESGDVLGDWAVQSINIM